MFDRFLSVLSLVSRFPVMGNFKFDTSRMDFYLPLTSIFPVILGLAGYFAALALTGFSLFAVAAALFVQYLGFNLFHLDGLADTADAFLGSQSREKRFLILKDSRIGVYGLFAGISAPAFKLLLLYGLLQGSDFPLNRLLVFIYPVAGRFAAALVPCITPPAKPDGLGALARYSKAGFACAGGAAALLIALPALSAAAAFSNLPFNIILCGLALLAGLLSAVFYAGIYGKALGGYTGDALGAAIETGEAVYLLFAAAAFNFAG